MPETKKEEWAQGESSELARLLRKVISDRGFWPTEEIFYLIAELTAQAATELVIFDGRERVLLTQYEKKWNGEVGVWHLPGGWVKPLMDTDLESTCNRISVRELGIKVQLRGILGNPYFWELGEHDSPNVRPVSLYAVVEPLETIVETAARRFFHIDHFPSPLIGGSHQHFFTHWRDYHDMARTLGFLPISSSSSLFRLYLG